MAIADRANSTDMASREENAGETRAIPKIAFRKPPAMRVVTKGWFTLKETEVDIRTLEKQDREQT
jgi:hypothetical protein